ncbi:S26 family signal peptidase [Sphingosinicella terrae]|uniref:S26 family signal peptidase n=1 Tax=Sphingosinicella terrae TaxID=2172047 RepID=UPI000E0D3144|nr:S26 family signal peptidase [Sphingosinicella terrae]
MAEGRDLALVRWGETLRRDRVRRRRRRRLTALAAIVSAASVASLAWPPRPLLLWNASPSAPVGLYGVTAPASVGAGDMVIAWPPAEARHLAGRRGYLPVNVPLVKRVAAAPGDSVCAVGEAVFVNGRLAARRREADGVGRPLSWWTGCLRLRAGQYLLLMSDSPSSFDGRYFGVTAQRVLVGKARLLWAP